MRRLAPAVKATLYTDSVLRSRSDGVEPEQERREGQHREEVLCACLVTGGKAAMLLQSVNESFHQVPRAVCVPVERCVMPVERAAGRGGVG